SPDGKYVAALRSTEVLLWNGQTSKLEQSQAKSKLEGAVTFSPNGALFAYSADGGLHVQDLQSGQGDRWPLPTRLAVKSIAFAPDGKTLAVGAPSGVRLWDTATKTEREFVKLFLGTPSSLAYSPDGKLLA